MSTLAIIVSIIGGLLTISLAFIGFWTVPLYRQLKSIHEEIRAKDDEIDEAEQKASASLVGMIATEEMRIRHAKTATATLRRELERLHQERQFIIDRLPFFK